MQKIKQTRTFLTTFGINMNTDTNSSFVLHPCYHQLLVKYGYNQDSKAFDVISI